MIQGGVPVLMYHHISPFGGPHTIRTETFRSQLEWLSEQGYKFLKADEFRNFYLNGVRTFDKAVLLTFDDGWLDNWVYAAPILKEFDASAIMFIISSWPSYGPVRAAKECDMRCDHSVAMKRSRSDAERDSVVMRWSELLSVQDQGVFELQSHSHSHGGWWGEVDDDGIHSALSHDLELNVETMQDKLDVTPLDVCWPKGFFGKTSKKLAKENGFLLQFSTLRGSNTFANDTSKLVRRLNVEEKPLGWFSSRVKFYSNPALSIPVSLLHQFKHSMTLAKRFEGKLSRDEFLSNPLRIS